MKISESHAAHLTYCLNIHPGERWDENLRAIQEKATRVQHFTAGDKPFGLGLRLSNEASVTLCEGTRLDDLKKLLAEQNMYVFTINGFPYGPFHGEPVQENVYRPDWRQPERLEYTKRLADILAELLPADCWGSISTVPGSYASWITSDDERDLMLSNLTECAEYLARIEQRAGRDICLALEPEPDCYLENTAQVITFFELLANAKSTGAAAKHIGICFDTCHMALQFEDLTTSLAQIHGAGISIPKVQISSALHMEMPGPAEELEQFCDPTYLHQVKILDNNEQVTSHPNLTAELIGMLPQHDCCDVRCHFHVPLYFQGTGCIKSTSNLLTEEFFSVALNIGVEHFEIETYTFDVLPEDIRPKDVTESIACEYEWVLDRMGGAE